MDSLLYGHNPEERIVAVQQLNDQIDTVVQAS